MQSNRLNLLTGFVVPWVLDRIGVDAEPMDGKQQRVAVFCRKDRVEMGIAGRRRRHVFMGRTVDIGEQSTATSTAGMGGGVGHSRKLNANFGLGNAPCDLIASLLLCRQCWMFLKAEWVQT